MRTIRGEFLLAIAIVMVLIGLIIPWLIVLKITPSTFFLLISSYVMSIGGFILGITSIVYTVDYYTAKKKAKLRFRSASSRSL
jgi:hypothetical protein